MAKKERYEDLANSVIDLVGGKDNITFFTHCVTRLRFNVKDKSAVKKEDIEKIQGVMGCQWSGDQLQIIIGQAVGDAYNCICEKNKLQKQKSINDNIENQKFVWTPKNVILAVMDGISGCIYPMAPVLIGAGMIKVLLLLLGSTGFNIISENDILFKMLTFLGDTAFYFMPVIFGASAAKKFNASLGLGVFMGAMLIHPAFIEMVNNGISMSIYGLPVINTTYTSTIIPIIMIVWVMSYVEKIVSKLCPDVIKSIVEPLATILIMFPLAFCIIGPIGVVIGEGLTNILMWLYDTTGIFGVGILAALYPLLIMTGMHATLVPSMLMLLATNGNDPLVLVANIGANLAIGAAALAVGLNAKDTNLKSISISSAITAIIGGVTEPALFGILLKVRKALFGACLGAFVGAIVAGLLHVSCYTLPGSGGVFAIPSFAGPGYNIVFTTISFVIGMLVTLIITTILLKKDKKELNY